MRVESDARFSSNNYETVSLYFIDALDDRSSPLDSLRLPHGLSFSATFSVSYLGVVVGLNGLGTWTILIFVSSIRFFIGLSLGTSTGDLSEHI